MKKLLFFITVIFPLCAAAQTIEYSDSVTRLRSEVRNNFIRLEWADSPVAKGTVFLFRSARPFIDTVPANIRPIPVSYGTQYYIDDIDDMENLYYFIAASDISGRRFDTIIPGVNSIGVFTGEKIEEEPSAPPVQTAAPVRAVQGIYDLKAAKDNDRIVVTFNVNGPAKNVVLYRSMRPVLTVQDLINAIVVQAGASSPYIDFPVPGIKWYYAAVFENEISSGNITLRSGINSTTQAVVISGSESARPALRPVPLPFITVNNRILSNGGSTDMINTVPLKSETEKELDSVETPGKEPLRKKQPRIFRVDIDPPSEGQESLLNKIVHDYFVKEDWENTIKYLTNFLSLPRSKELQARARYYLGQALYFSGLYREALFEFLPVQTMYPDEANSWIDSILAAIVY